MSFYSPLPILTVDKTNRQGATILPDQESHPTWRRATSSFRPATHSSQPVSRERSTTKHFVARHNSAFSTPLNFKNSNVAGREIRRYGVVLYCSHGDATKPNTFLMVKQRDSGFWGPMKGSILANETGHVCASRELFEETGIRISPEEIARSTEKRLTRWSHTLYVLRVDTEISCTVDQREIVDWRWMTLAELRRCPISNATRILFRQLRRKRTSEMRQRTRYRNKRRDGGVASQMSVATLLTDSLSTPVVDVTSCPPLSITPVRRSAVITTIGSMNRFSLLLSDEDSTGSTVSSSSDASSPVNLTSGSQLNRVDSEALSDCSCTSSFMCMSCESSAFHSRADSDGDDYHSSPSVLTFDNHSLNIPTELQQHVHSPSPFPGAFVVESSSPSSSSSCHPDHKRRPIKYGAILRNLLASHTDNNPQLRTLPSHPSPHIQFQRHEQPRQQPHPQQRQQSQHNRSNRINNNSSNN